MWLEMLYNDLNNDDVRVNCFVNIQQKPSVNVVNG